MIKIKNIFTILLLISFLGIAFLGCSFPVNVVPNPLISVEEKIPLDVGLYVDTTQAQQIYSRSGLCLIGTAHTWQVETGGALNLGAEKTFQ